MNTGINRALLFIENRVLFKYIARMTLQNIMRALTGRNILIFLRHLVMYFFVLQNFDVFSLSVIRQPHGKWNTLIKSEFILVFPLTCGRWWRSTLIATSRETRVIDCNVCLVITTNDALNTNIERVVWGIKSNLSSDPIPVCRVT